MNTVGRAQPRRVVAVNGDRDFTNSPCNFLVARDPRPPSPGAPVSSLGPPGARARGGTPNSTWNTASSPPIEQIEKPYRRESLARMLRAILDGEEG